MKPLHVGLLVAAGTLAGALVMYNMGPSSAPPPAPVSAQAPATPAPEATPAQPAAEPKAEPDQQLPSAFPERNEKRAAAPEKRSAPRRTRPERSTVARNEPPAAAPASPGQSPAPAVQQPAPAVSAPSPAPAVPEVRPEPEHVTPAPPPPPPPPHRVTVAAGTLLPVRLGEGLSTDRNQPGDSFTATLAEPLVVDGFVIAERGARLSGRVVESERAGRVKGVSSIGIELTNINTSDGQRVAIKTDTFTKQGQKSVGKDAAKVGAAAGIGAAIGAIAGGGKGAAIGAAVGGAAGTGGVMATRGEAATLATETRINFRLREPVTLTEHKP